jgi:glycosyltransferase involved in cell wall biosynthesis
MLSRNDSIALVAYQWAEAVVAAGHRAAVVGDRGPDTPDSGEVEIAALRHVGKGPTLTPVGLGRLLEDDDVLVLHTDWRFANLFAAEVARRKGIPYLVVPHGGYEAQVLPRVRDPLRYRVPAERRMLQRALGVHVFFPTEVPMVEALAPGARFVVAPTGFDPPAAPTWTGGGGYLAWLGRYDIGHKGLDLVLEALSLLPPDGRPTVAMHGIDWPDSAAVVRALAQRIGVSDHVTVEGPIFGDAKARFLERSDGFLHAARWESYGLAILENLTAGVPCLVSTATHLGQHWRDRGAFVLADPTPQGVATGMQELASADAGEMTERGRQAVVDDLAWPTVAGAFLEGVGRLLAVAATR